MKPEHVKRWPKAYNWVFIDDVPRYEPVWPDDAPEPTEGMIRRGAIYLGHGTEGRNYPRFRGWMFSPLDGYWDSGESFAGFDPKPSHYALNPTDPNADAIIREFRPDLVEEHAMTASEQRAMDRALWGSVDQLPEAQGDAPWYVAVSISHFNGPVLTLTRCGYHDAMTKAQEFARNKRTKAYVLAPVALIDLEPTVRPIKEDI